MNSNQQRIHELAHQIWESEGRPHGQSVRHWDTACKLVTAENEIDKPTPAEALSKTSEPSKAKKSPDKKPKKNKAIAEKDETLLAVAPKTEKKPSTKKSKSPTP